MAAGSTGAKRQKIRCAGASERSCRSLGVFYSGEGGVVSQVSHRGNEGACRCHCTACLPACLPACQGAHLVVRCDIQRHDSLQDNLRDFVVGKQRVSVDGVEVAVRGHGEGAAAVLNRGIQTKQLVEPRFDRVIRAVTAQEMERAVVESVWGERRAERGTFTQKGAWRRWHKHLPDGNVKRQLTKNPRAHARDSGNVAIGGARAAGGGLWQRRDADARQGR